MEIIKYDMNWCEYFTPCPNIHKEDNKIFVGSYECCECCPYCLNHDFSKHQVYCSFKSF